MKKGKKEIIEILKTTTKKESKFENLVLNLALQKMTSDKFEFDGKAVYTADKSLFTVFKTKRNFIFLKRQRQSDEWHLRNTNI